MQEARNRNAKTKPFCSLMPHSKHQITPITSTFFSKDPTHLPSGYKSFNKENVTFAFSLPKISGHHCDKEGKNMGASSSFGCYTLIHLPIKCLRKVVEDGHVFGFLPSTWEHWKKLLATSFNLAHYWNEFHC